MHQDAFKKDCQMLTEAFFEVCSNRYGQEYGHYLKKIVTEQINPQELLGSMQILNSEDLHLIGRCCGLALEIVTLVQHIHKTLDYLQHSRFDLSESKKIVLDCFIVIQAQETLEYSFDQAWHQWLEIFYQYKLDKGAPFDAPFPAQMIKDFQQSCSALLDLPTILEHLTLDQAHHRISHSYESFWQQSYGIVKQHLSKAPLHLEVQTSHVFYLKFDEEEAGVIEKFGAQPEAYLAPKSYAQQLQNPTYWAMTARDILAFMTSLFFMTFHKSVEKIFKEEQKKLKDYNFEIFFQSYQKLSSQHKLMWQHCVHLKKHHAHRASQILISDIRSLDQIKMIIWFFKNVLSYQHPFSLSFEDPEAIKSATLILDGIFEYDENIKLEKIVIGNLQHAKNLSFWATHILLYHSQEELILWKQKNAIHFDIVQSRGGSVARGSLPTRCLIANTLFEDPHCLYLGLFFHADALRQRFSSASISAMTLLRYSQELLSQKIQSTIDPRIKSLQKNLSEISLIEVNYYTFEQPDLIDYFYSITPVEYLSAQHQAHHKTYDINKVKSTLWFGCWSQSRLFLPFWLGFADVLRQWPSDETEEAQLLQSDPSTVALYTVIMIGVYRVNLDIVKLYEHILVSSDLRELGDHLRTRFSKILELQESNDILKDDLYLRNFKQDIAWREQYLYPLHITQMLLLSQARQDFRSQQWKDFMRESMLLLALGLQNSI